MDRAGFRVKLRRMAEANGVGLAKEGQLMDAVARYEREPDVVNVFRGTRPQSILLITAAATYALELRLLSVRVHWAVPHDDVHSVQAVRKEVEISVTDEIVLVGSFGRVSFEFGFHSGYDYDETNRRVAEYNCHVAVAEIDRWRARRQRNA